MNVKQAWLQFAVRHFSISETHAKTCWKMRDLNRNDSHYRDAAAFEAGWIATGRKSTNE